MKLKIFTLLLLLNAMVFFIGCYSAASGHMKAGNPISKDKITSRYQRPVPAIINATREVLRRSGPIVLDDTANNVVQAKIDQRNVWVKVTEIDPNVSEVVVQARSRSGGGDVDLASEISKQIGIQLAVGR